MRSAHIVMAAALIGAAVGGHAFLAASSAGAQRIEHRSEPRNGGYTISGRAVECRNVRVVLDRHLPSEGAAAPGVLILNPRMLGGQPEVVRLFVFHHECGHHHVGASELQADCWAVRRGVDAGWLGTWQARTAAQSTLRHKLETARRSHHRLSVEAYSPGENRTVPLEISVGPLTSFGTFWACLAAAAASSTGFLRSRAAMAVAKH